MGVLWVDISRSKTLPTKKMVQKETKKKKDIVLNILARFFWTYKFWRCYIAFDMLIRSRKRQLGNKWRLCASICSKLALMCLNIMPFFLLFSLLAVCIIKSYYSMLLLGMCRYFYIAIHYVWNVWLFIRKGKSNKAPYIYTLL